MVAVPSRGRADLQAHAPEADATHALYEQYGRQLYAYCFSRLRSREEAEDAVQSTFLNAFRALQRDVAPSHEAAWLYKIAENVCLTRARSSVRRRRVESPGDLEAISEVVPAHEPDAEELVNLPQALESMPEQQRRALLLREWQGLSYREIAEEMDLSQSAVETLLFRARRTLASGLVDEPKPRRRLARLRAGGDAGAVAALLKTLLFSGGGKVVIAGAVAASSVVGVSPGTRHSIDDLFVPHVKAPVHHVAAATPKPKAPVTHTPVVVAPVVVQHTTAAPVEHAVPKKKAHTHTLVPRHHGKAKPKPVHVRGGENGDQPAPTPAAPTTPAPAAAPAAAAATPAGAATVVAPLTPTPAPSQQQDQGNGKDNGQHQGKAQHDTQSSQPAPPAPVVPPVVPDPTPAPAPAPPAPGESGNGDNGNSANGHGQQGNGHGHSGN